MTSTVDLEIGKPITLQCGLTLPNRLVKAALTEEMGRGNLLPDERIFALYRRWAESGWGMVLTGTTSHLGGYCSSCIPSKALTRPGALHIDANYIGSPTALTIDEALPEETIHNAFSSWAQACKGPDGRTPALVQINHPGRQSPAGAGKRGFFSKSIAPSALPMNLGPGLIARAASKIAFGTPRAMTIADIDAVVAQFARAARISAEAGFDGVQIHAAHGYLLAQFLSASCNIRTDAYGGSPENRARIIVEVIQAVRAAGSGKKGFCVGIKLNSVDHQSVSELKDCIVQLRLIVQAGVDFLEVSGGSYEDPQMSSGPAGYQNEPVSARTAAREAFFLEFAKSIRTEFPEVPLVVTGGFRTRNGMEAAVAGGDCDMVGLGRAAILNPLLPQTIVFNPEVKNADATLYVKRVPTPWYIKFLGIRAVGAGIEAVSPPSPSLPP